MTADLTRFHQVFFEEAGEHLDAMERLLLGLDIVAPDPDDLNAIFRAAHSIKGGAGTFGFTDLTKVTHVLETLLDKLRNFELALRAEMVEVFLAAADVLRAQLAGHRDQAEVDPDVAVRVTARLHELSAPASPTPPTPSPSQAAVPCAPCVPHRIVYRPATASDEAADNLRREFANLGTTVLANESLPDGKRAYVYTIETSNGADALRDVLAYVALPGEAEIDGIPVLAVEPGTADHAFGFFDDAPGLPPADDPGYGFFTELPAAVPAPEADPGYGFFTPVAESPEPSRPVNAAPPRAPAKAAEKASGSESSIRVSVDKVDQMINLVGELVITQAMLAQTVGHLDPAQYECLMNGMAQLERNTRDLQESVMSIRMMPMSFVFSRYPRVVHDLARQLGKDIELVTHGESTELDKGLIEKIVDPLTHLVRNSLDHGIESPEKRLAAGKEARGTVTLRAAHQGGNIVIEVEDNGAGLQRDKLLAKAREKGLPVSDAMSDQEVWQLIFAPGFSTAEVVTDVSGRGVGMDVVKRNIDALGGRVEIASSTGFGTKVTIRLPLTLAILDGMSVGIGQEVFIIPLAYIVESLQPTAGDVRSVSGQGQVVQVRNEYLPLVPLYQRLGLAPRSVDATQAIVVIVETGAGKMAFLVDELLGQHQVVIKSMEANYRKVPGIAGATIMGDGRVALILDVAALAKAA